MFGPLRTLCVVCTGAWTLLFDRARSFVEPKIVFGPLELPCVQFIGICPHMALGAWSAVNRQAKTIFIVLGRARAHSEMSGDFFPAAQFLARPTAGRCYCFHGFAVM